MVELSKIVSIEACGEIDMIDIETSGNRLFYANDILTHNSGYDNSDINLTDTSESFGLPATADLMIALISTDELKQLNQMMVKQLKNRYADPEMFKRFIIGVDKSRMKLYDAEQSAQNDLMNDAIVPNTSFGQRASKKPSFDGFK
jgi:hypothetical protein